jgi:hypothetical protein
LGVHKPRLPFLPIAINEIVAFGRMSDHAALDFIRYAEAALTYFDTSRAKACVGFDVTEDAADEMTKERG